uniref:hypothetical protein n=1 Tax=Actinomyces bouchesdurhonensis TaxID=1852361 RepID=UPI00190EE0CA
VLLGLLRLVARVRVVVSPGVVLLVLRVGLRVVVMVLVLRVVLLGLLRLVVRVRVAVSPGVVLLVLRVVLLAWLGLGRRAVVRRRMRRGGVTMRWCVWMAWMSPLLV